MPQPPGETKISMQYAAEFSNGSPQIAFCFFILLVAAGDLCEVVAMQVVMLQLLLHLACFCHLRAL